jgi:hypothetical protein
MSIRFSFLSLIMPPGNDKRSSGRITYGRIRGWYIVGEDPWYMVAANTWYIVGED